jgi:hypothetical protein
MEAGNTLSSSFLGYFRQRHWLVVWLAVFAAGLIVLAVTGQIHTQGSGWPTIYEWSVVSSAVMVWIAAKLFLKLDLSEEYLMGIIFGIQWEFLTEPYWTYLPDKFNVLVWKDLPLMGLFGWGPTLTIAMYSSNWLARRFFKLTPEKLLFDPRILLCDAIAIQIVGSLAEWTYGILFHCWDYAISFGIGKSPLGLGWEVHIGYVFVFFWYGTTMRVWKSRLEGQPCS